MINDNQLSRRADALQYTRDYYTQDSTTTVYAGLLYARLYYGADGGHGGNGPTTRRICALTNFSTKITAPLWGLTSLDIEHVSI